MSIVFIEMLQCDAQSLLVSNFPYRQVQFLFLYCQSSKVNVMFFSCLHRQVIDELNLVCV